MNRPLERAPWPDYAGNPIHEGDTIRHPTSGEEGVVFVLADQAEPGDRWRVLYGRTGDGWPSTRVSRLCLQIDYKGQAVVVSSAAVKHSEAGEETCSTAGATMPPNPVHCSTRDGSGDAWPDPVEHNLDLTFADAFRPRRPAGYDLGVFAVDESAKWLQLDDLRNYGSTFTRIGSSGERERIPPGDVYLGTQSEIGHLDPNETMDDLRRRLRSTMAVSPDLIRKYPRILAMDARIHGYALAWQERLRKLFERNQFLPDDPGPTVCYGDPRERLLRAPDADSTFYRLFDRDRALHECPPGMSALEHVRARAPWRDIAPVIWANLQRYGHTPIPFNPATWTGAR